MYFNSSQKTKNEHEAKAKIIKNTICNWQSVEHKKWNYKANTLCKTSNETINVWIDNYARLKDNCIKLFPKPFFSLILRFAIKVK